MLETIYLDVEEANELLFKVQIEGADPAPAKVRMVCDGGDLGFIFNGKSGPEGSVQFNLPVMKDKLREGLYQARVEVLIENRYFAPVQFQINFKKAVKVVAEALTFSHKKTSDIKVTAAPIVVTKQTPVSEAPARENAAITLKERFHLKKDDVVVEAPKDLDEETILAAARSFVVSRKKK